MGPAVAVIVIGVLCPVSFVVLVISFARLRSDLHAGFDRLEARFDKMDEKFDRLEAKFDDLESALVGKGQRTGPEVPSGVDD